MFLLKHKRVDLHKSIVYVNAIKMRFMGPLDEISEYMLFTVIDGDHFGCHALQNFIGFSTEA